MVVAGCIAGYERQCSYSDLMIAVRVLCLFSQQLVWIQVIQVYRRDYAQLVEYQNYYY